MGKPLVVTISHSLGREAAVQRIKNGLAEASKVLADNKIVLAEYRWMGDRADFVVTAMGQTAKGTIDVEDALVRLQVELPWMLAFIAERAKSVIEKRGMALLEQKPA